jgi:hypothetical protein
VLNTLHLSQCGKGMNTSPEARHLRPQQQQSEREHAPELHLHSQAPGSRIAAPSWLLVVDKEDVVRNCVLAGSFVKRPKGLKEGASAQEYHMLRTTSPEGIVVLSSAR